MPCCELCGHDLFVLIVPTAGRPAGMCVPCLREVLDDHPGAIDLPDEARQALRQALTTTTTTAARAA